MNRLSLAFRAYIAHRSATSAQWRHLRVVFSDASVPGEGEHKIMDFIRSQRTSGGAYDPNAFHCMYGMDADLIMLALALHEPRFYILRDRDLWDDHNLTQVNRPRCDARDAW
jgi:5'-3' exoribonuclease 2